MSSLSLFGRTKLREMASQFQLATYVPQLTFQGLVAGVDNLRPDIFLSAKFTEIARVHLANLIEQHGDVQLLARVPEAFPFGDSPYGRAHVKDDALPEPEVDYPAQFKYCLSELQVASLRRAREAGDIQLDLVCRVGLVKFLRTELALQFTHVLECCRENLKKRDERRLELQQMVLRDRFLRFQVSKRQVLRRVSQDVLATLNEVERETVASTRHALFGDREAAGYEVVTNRLLLADSSHDPFIRAEQYALFGSFDRDPDLFDHLVVIAKSFLKKLGLAHGDVEAEEQLNVPENVKMLMYSGLVDDSLRGRAQREITASWMETLEAAKLMDFALAAYEVVPILGDYGAVVSPQQLKWALVLKSELRRVEEVLETHDRYPLDKLDAAVQRVRSAGKAERMRCAARYLIDISRFHRDVRKLEVLKRALESVNVVSNERLRELSEINGTLYQFLLPEEEKPAEQRVNHHVVLKADIRDSSFLTRSLMERGLNPASFFSLNFFEPVNKLLPKYGAEKVFIEGDAVILALLENEGNRGFGVARTCVLAREILNIVSAYNSALTENGLPPLEIGIGIAYQSSAPLYLMDGAHRIMISEALNLSDRLSACHKRARRQMKDSNSLFNVVVFQTVDEQSAAGALEDFLLNYNVGGIHLPLAAFQKLQDEISLEEFKMELPMPWGPEPVRLFRGLVPVSPGVFRPILVREGRAAQVEARDFSFVRWAEHSYYEVCSNPELVMMIERQHFGQAT
jgi:predicted metal-dependent hydrolase